MIFWGMSAFVVALAMLYLPNRACRYGGVRSFGWSMLLCTLLYSPVQAKTPYVNPAFAGSNNQVSMHFGVSAYGERFEGLFLTGVQYSQPNVFFRIHGRRSVELMTARGGGELSRYSQLMIFGFTQDALLPISGPVYTGINLGIYIKSNATDRISSKFTFGEKLFLGIGIFNGVVLELYGRHFSNGTLTEINSGQNFAGVSVIKNF